MWSDCGCWRERRRGAAGDSRLSISCSFPNWWVWCEGDSNMLLTCILSGLERAFSLCVCMFTVQEALERAVLAYCREAEREEEEGTQNIVRQPFRYVFMVAFRTLSSLLPPLTPSSPPLSPPQTCDSDPKGQVAGDYCFSETCISAEDKCKESDSDQRSESRHTRNRCHWQQQ